MANEEHLQRLKQGVSAWNVWRQEHPNIRIDLWAANLSGAHLTAAHLDGADLRRAYFYRADLHLANLIAANLDGATLTDACLWETQREGWSIQGIICEAVYWDTGIETGESG